MRGNANVGARVAVTGAGGIGCDVAEFLVEDAPSPATDVARWTHGWGFDPTPPSLPGPMPCAALLALAMSLIPALRALHAALVKKAH